MFHGFEKCKLVWSFHKTYICPTLLFVAEKTSPPTAHVENKGLICLIRLQGPSEQDSRQDPGGKELKQNPQPTGLLPVVAQLAFL